MSRYSEKIKLYITFNYALYHLFVVLFITKYYKIGE